MFFARMSIWTFKKGKREMGLAKMAEMVSNTARNSKGYRGFLELLSEEKPDCATIITLWENDKALDASSKGVFKEAVNVLEQYLECPPEVSNFKLTDSEIRI